MRYLTVMRKRDCCFYFAVFFSLSSQRLCFDLDCYGSVAQNHNHIGICSTRK